MRYMISNMKTHKFEGFGTPIFSETWYTYLYVLYLKGFKPYRFFDFIHWKGRNLFFLYEASRSLYNRQIKSFSKIVRLIRSYLQIKTWFNQGRTRTRGDPRLNGKTSPQGNSFVRRGDSRTGIDFHVHSGTGAPVGDPLYYYPNFNY